jgi:poly-beta-hydroxyalkanoate depolymerase
VSLILVVAPCSGADKKLVGTTIGHADRDRLNQTEPYLMFFPTSGHKDNLYKEDLMALKPDVVISSVDYVNANEVSK